MSRVVRAVVMGVVLVLVGCSGESSAPTTTTASTTTTSTTESTTTTSSTTTTTSSTTLDPQTEIEADVEAAYLRAYEVFVDCYRTLPDCDPNEVFPEAYTEPTLAAQVIAALETKADGLVYGPPIDADHERSEIVDISVNDDGSTAIVSFCSLGGDQEFVLTEDGDRTPTNNNDTVFVEWGDAIMILGDDGTWRLSTFADDVGGDVELLIAEVDRQLEEGTICDGWLD